MTVVAISNRRRQAFCKRLGVLLEQIGACPSHFLPGFGRNLSDARRSARLQSVQYGLVCSAVLSVARRAASSMPCVDFSSWRGFAIFVLQLISVVMTAPAPSGNAITVGPFPACRSFPRPSMLLGERPLHVRFVQTGSSTCRKFGLATREAQRMCAAG